MRQPGPVSIGGSMITGPGIDPQPTRRAPAANRSTADSLVDAGGAIRLAEHDGDGEPGESSQAAKRLLVVVLIAIVTIPVFLYLMHISGIKLSPLMILLLVAPFVVGVIAAGASEPKKATKQRPPDGRPVGCCPGPGTLPSSRQRCR